MNEPSFEFYFSYEIGDGASPVGLEMDCFILTIECATGDIYELTVWTETYLARVRQHDRERGDNLSGQYLIPSDLIIAKHDVDLIERIVADLIQSKRLRATWQIPDELTASWAEDSVGDDDEDDPRDAWAGAEVADHTVCGCCHAHPRG
jgi:hypothetical protein